MIRTLLVSLMFCILGLHCHGQVTFYYGVNNKPVVSETQAVIIKELHHKSESKYVLTTRIRSTKQWIEAERQKIRILNDGILRIRIPGEGFFPKIIDREINLLDHHSFYAFEESNKGNLIRTGTSSSYLPLHLDGIITEYHPNGIEKSVSVFQNNQLMSNQNWLSDGTSYIDSIIYSADKEPVYQPGVAYFHSYLLQQIGELKINLDEYDDKVVIGWVVMENGSIDGVIALEGKSDQLNQLLVEIIARIPGEWEAAILDGKPVRYFMSIPLNITHDEVNFQDLEFSMGVLHYNRY